MHIGHVMHETVGFLCVDVETDDGPTKAPIGTCFFVCVFDDEKRETGTSYLVTAKHVWSAYFASGAKSYVRLNTDPPITAVYTELTQDWRFHPDETVDMAVLPMRGVTGNRGMHNTMDIGDIVDTARYSSQQLKRSWPPGVGETVVYIGMMAEYPGRVRNRPIARFGHVSLVTDERIEGPFGPSEYYLTELQSYPGHSGGPVWVVYGEELILLGVMVAGIPGLQRVIGVPGSSEVLEQYYNLGITLITPIERLPEILLTPEMVQERKGYAAARQPLTKPIAT
jgi:hypothetical protein